MTIPTLSTEAASLGEHILAKLKGSGDEGGLMDPFIEEQVRAQVETKLSGMEDNLAKLMKENEDLRDALSSEAPGSERAEDRPHRLHESE